MIIGAHIMLQSTNDTADKAFFSEVLKLSSVDAGGGFHIFAVPPAEVAVHGSDRNSVHQLYFMCDDVRATIASLQTQGVTCSPIAEERWGITTRLTLPSGGQIGLYQPLHPTAIER